VVLFFCLIWRGYERNVDCSQSISEEITAFVQKERSSTPLKPEICFVGASITGMGIERNVLYQKLKCNIAKIALGNNTIRETSNIIKKYENEFKNTRIVVVEYGIFNIRKDTRKQIKQRFRFLKNIFDTKYSYMQLTWTERFLPVRFSIRSIRRNINPIGKFLDYEGHWSWGLFAQKNEKFTKNIQKNITVLREREKNGIQNTSFPHERLEESLIPEAIRLLEYCQKKRIFVIFSVYPGETSRHFPCGNKLSSVEYKYLASIQELKNQPGCAVIVADNFNDILPEPRDYTKKPALTFDDAHMTHEGATIYTNWLADQMLNDPKIMIALKTSRKPEEFFVKKYAKKSYRKITNYFKKKETPVTIAQPMRLPIR
jgi:hypothetical protein